MMNIRNRKIGMNEPAFIVAEIGANHNNDFALIKKTIDAAAYCGVDAVKFQTYTSSELLSDYDRVITYESNGVEVSEKIGELFDKLSLPHEWHKDLFEYAQSKGLIAFSTPFSAEGVRFLNSLDAPCFKIAASDVNYLDMLVEIAKTNKPTMLSLGKCTIGEADRAISLLEQEGCEDLVIMHCVAQYPSPMEEMNLKVIQTLQLQYPNAIVGFSDHSIGATAAIGAVVLGAKVIEKHFTLDKTLEGPDHWFSLDPTEMKFLVDEIRNVEMALGMSRKKVVSSEIGERKTSIRSLVMSQNIKSGQMISRDMLKMTRPGWGIDPGDIEKVIGLRVTQDLKENTVLKWEYFK